MPSWNSSLPTKFTLTLRPFGPVPLNKACYHRAEASPALRAPPHSHSRKSFVCKCARCKLSGPANPRRRRPSYDICCRIHSWFGVECCFDAVFFQEPQRPPPPLCRRVAVCISELAVPKDPLKVIACFVLHQVFEGLARAMTVAGCTAKSSFLTFASIWLLRLLLLAAASHPVDLVLHVLGSPQKPDHASNGNNSETPPSFWATVNLQGPQRFNFCPQQATQSGGLLLWAQTLFFFCSKCCST